MIATLVLQRNREIGIRLAHGAQSTDILSMVLSDGAKLVVPGLVAGLILSVLAGPIVRGFLFQVGPLDALSLGGTVAVLGLVSALASTFPAMRAMRVDPSVALRDG